MIKIFLNLILFFMWSLSVNAQNCIYSVSVNNFVSEIDTSEQSVAHSVTVKSYSNSSNCRNVRLYFSKGYANSYNRAGYNGNKTVPYNIYKESSLNTVLKDYGDATGSEYIDLSLDNSQRQATAEFYMKVVDLDSVFSNGPGWYNDLIQIKAYSVHNNGSLTYRRSGYMNVQTIIPRYAELSLVAPGSGHDPNSTSYVLSFGDLTEGEVGQAALNVKSTVSFGIYMSSLNGSKLVNGNDEIPYQVNVNNGGYRNLNGAGQTHYITQRNLSAPVNFETFPILVKIGTISEQSATGSYSDVITVTVTPW